MDALNHVVALQKTRRAARPEMLLALPACTRCDEPVPVEHVALLLPPAGICSGHVS